MSGTEAAAGRVRFALASFAGPNELLAAARKVRDAGYRQFDCHSPFAVHGMNEAMGIRRSIIGWVAGGSAPVGGAGLRGRWRGGSSTRMTPFPAGRSPGRTGR